MNYEQVIFWIVCLSCLSGVVALAKRGGRAGRGGLLIFGVILLVSVTGRLWDKAALIYAGFGMWLLFVLCPGLLSRLYFRLFFQQRYAAACGLARVIGWLHPSGGWRQQSEIVHALGLAQAGDIADATERLKRFQGEPSLAALSALTNLFRITNQWEELLAWHARTRGGLEQHSQLLPLLLRAHGETADLPGMVALYERNRERIARLVPAASRDLCRLALFAFCGRRNLVERLFAGSLALTPAATREFWLATADMAGGATGAAQHRMEELLAAADPVLRRAIEWRLSRISVRTPPLNASEERVLEEAAHEYGHDEKFGAQRSFFSRQARATQLLIALNVLMFGLEILFGGSTNSEALYRLGALFAPAVLAGEWWRLMTSLFLHLGSLHLAMNMLGLWLLGPYVEFALGFRRFLTVYLLAGMGSMGLVMLLGSGPDGEQLTVGASGSILGLVGVTGALMLRGWLREKALSAKRRLVSMLVIVGMQTVFDSLIPQVSMTAHLSGVMIGFVLTLLLRDKLGAASRATPTLEQRQ
jgi:rhomboid protease GluP